MKERKSFWFENKNDGKRGKWEDQMEKDERENITHHNIRDASDSMQWIKTSSSRWQIFLKVNAVMCFGS